MKRFLILFLCAFAAFPLFAQQSDSEFSVLPSMKVNQHRKLQKEKMWAEFPKFEVRLGYSGFPLVDLLNYGLEGLEWPDLKAGRLENMYTPAEGATYMTGNFSGEFSWHVCRWFTLAAGVYFNGVYGSTIDPSSGEVTEHFRRLTFSVLPTARFHWANFRKCRLYSSVSLGVSNSSWFKDYSYTVPGIQFSPFGFTAGNRFFFYGEYSMGSVYFGGQLGVGYRF